MYASGVWRFYERAAVYEDEQKTYQHILLFGDKNSYVVLIIDVANVQYWDIDKEYHTDK